MEPAIDIITYLWDSRKTWFNHQNDECQHPFEGQVEDFLDQLNVAAYAEIVLTDDGPIFTLLHHTADEWSELIGPKARDKYLQDMVDHHMNIVTEILALQATESRQSDE